MEVLPGQPLPVPSPLTQPFWDGCRKHRLSLQRCCDCRKFRFYPTAGCPHCASPDARWETVSGRGAVYSWIVVDRTHDPYWRTRVPYVCAIVELREQKGLFMPGLLVGVDPSEVRAAMAVEIVFEDVTPAVSLPRWRKEESAAD
jgi:uncharacterized OB-fold protein